MNFPLTEVAAALGVSCAGCPSLPVTGWSVDSRSVQPGDVFFAIRGPNHDGHQFVEDIFRRGAVAAVVDRPVQAAGPLLQTGDSLEALQTLAAWARRRWGGKPKRRGPDRRKISAGGVFGRGHGISPGRDPDARRQVHRQLQ